MTYLIVLDDRAPQPLAAIHVHAAYADLDLVLASSVAEVYAHLTRTRTPPAGPPVAQYRHTGDGFDLTIGVPVAAPVAPGGRVTAATLPGGTIASTVHTGRFTALTSAYDALHDWLDGTGHTACGRAWETYPDGTLPRPRRTIPARQRSLTRGRL